jgi:DNA (cytosine-5)-methyltransferase 1
MTPRLLDLFCGEGGAGMGYHRAGFEVLGVDLDRAPLQRYPFDHRRSDALSYLADNGHLFAAIHASPPCKLHTALAASQPGDDLDGMLFPLPTHRDWVGATRDALEATGLPYIIENVPGAPLRDPIVLCGSMFGLGADCSDGRRELRRHRLFESNVPIKPPAHPAHAGRAIGVYGGGRRPGAGVRYGGAYQGTVGEGREALGAPWMTQAGLSQAIPPDYTEWLGAQLLDHLTPAVTPVTHA